MLPTPNGFKRPERICGSVWISEPIAIWVLPAITSIIAGPPPLNGMCTMSRPDCSLNSELARCWKLPSSLFKLQSGLDIVHIPFKGEEVFQRTDRQVRG